MKPIMTGMLALGLCTLYSPASAQGSDTLRLSLDEALRLGLEQSIAIASADLASQQSEYTRRGNVGQLFPNISASGAYSYALKKQRVYFGGGDNSNNPMASMMPEDGIEMGQTHNLQAGVNMQMPLIAPSLWASLGIDRVAVEQALERARASRVDLTAEIRKAYLAVLLTSESLEVLERSLDNTLTTLGNTREKYKRGLVAEYDVVRLEAQAQNLRPEVLRARQAHRLAGMKLLVLMGQEPSRPLVLSEQLSQYEEQVYRMMRPRGEVDMSDNATLRGLELSGRQLEAALRVRKAAFMPTLGVAFNYTYNFASDQFSLSNSKRWSPFSNISLSLNIPLFAGGSRYYGIKATKTQIQQLALQRVQAEREVRLGLESAQSEQRSALEQYEASREAVRSAAKGLEIARVRYRTGESSILELNDAELADRQSRLNLNQAIYNYMVATYNLEQLEGKGYQTGSNIDKQSKTR